MVSARNLREDVADSGISRGMGGVESEDSVWSGAYKVASRSESKGTEERDETTMVPLV